MYAGARDRRHASSVPPHPPQSLEHQMSLRKTAVATALIATLGAGIVPAASQAATTTPPTITKHYNVATGAIQANAQRTVPVTVTVTNPVNSVKSWSSKKTVQDVTNLAVTGGWKKPFRA